MEGILLLVTEGDFLILIHSDYFPQIRTLIKQIKEYGVNEDDLFHEDDLLERANIPRVCKCLKEIAIIVSIL